MAERFPTAGNALHKLKKLGEGGYGSVYLVQHPTWGEVVLKTLRDRNDIGAHDLDILRHEADVLKALRHPSIVTIYEGQFDRKLCGLFLEHVKYGSVDSFLKEFSVSVEWKMQIIYDIASAMTYLHGRQPPIIHGDLKCQNVLIGNDFRAKICDFGLDRMNVISKSTTPTTAPLLYGSPGFIAPEYLFDVHKRKTEKFDVYTYALIVWEIFSQRQAYPDFCEGMKIHESVVNGKRPQMQGIFDNFNEAVVKMIQDCWHQNEGARPTFEHIKNSVHGECARIQSQIKESYFSLVDQQRNQQRETGVTMRSQEQKTLYPDFGVSMRSSTKRKPQQTLDVQLVGTIKKEPNKLSEVFKEDFLGKRTLYSEYVVAWLENEIYVTSDHSTRVLVFADHEPFNELKDKRIEIPKKRKSWDMTASKVSRSIFISDDRGWCVWRIQMPSKKVSRWEIGGDPRGLSINSSDELIVVVKHVDTHLKIYRCMDCKEIQSIHLPWFSCVRHVVQSSRGTFIISHVNTAIPISPEVNIISEVSRNGKDIIRTFDPVSSAPEELRYWEPAHLAIDDGDNIFVADSNCGKLILFNPRLDEFQILLSREKHQNKAPLKLCYVREKHMLIVGHHEKWPLVSLLSVSKHHP